jgi:hypothetical protein
MTRPSHPIILHRYGNIKISVDDSLLEYLLFIHYTDFALHCAFRNECEMEHFGHKWEIIKHGQNICNRKWPVTDYEHICCHSRSVCLKTFHFQILKQILVLYV